MIKFIYVVIALMITSYAQAAVQTDTHTYIVSTTENKVLVIDRKTGTKKVIAVGEHPESMIIHGDFGYLVNYRSNTVSIIDLQTHKVNNTIPVGENPSHMVIHGDFGYVVNKYSDNISVLDLKTNTVTQTIPVGKFPQSMVIHKNLGYVVNQKSYNISVLDLKTNTVTQTIPVGEHPKSMIIHGDFGYVVISLLDNTVSVIDLKTNTVTHTIPVRTNPMQIVIHGNFGYVEAHNIHNSSISVIDLKTNEATQTIPVGNDPTHIVIHGDFGYVLNNESDTVSVIDLQTHEVKSTIPVGRSPEHMHIHNNLGYVNNDASKNVSVIDLKSNTVIATLRNPQDLDIDFSDTHLYLGINEVGPHYPTLASIQKLKEENKLSEFTSMNPKAFKVGEVKPRDYPVEENQFDQLPPYVLAQNLFWDLDTNKPLMDPVDILATLITMKYPQKFLQMEAGRWLRPRLHMAFFQAVWTGRTKKAQAMLRYFIQLKDPVMIKLATYTMAKPAGTLTGATNSTSK